MPEELKKMMSRQASAEREKRATITKAEGDKVAAVNLAAAARYDDREPWRDAASDAANHRRARPVCIEHRRAGRAHRDDASHQRLRHIAEGRIPQPNQFPGLMTRR